ncbi:ATP-dependent DNA helicase RecQ-like [Hydractinia symbiolongicarpus]|uniref:ATP-dependent DNA helicase RecQ-like n=1 Tax=Hydractinia symbiolongicarpus TaxID=13093 RepID=UPI00254C07EF|nr:ATP-dependent DNA helicase RecQ-like [Hydractinia symbiolongicarpus]
MDKILQLFCRLQQTFLINNINNIILKPQQVKCFEHLLNGYDVIGVLPTGFGKSLLFHLLADFLPRKSVQNIVLMVCPLNSIIEDQLKVLEVRGIGAGVLHLEQTVVPEKLFSCDENGEPEIPISIENGELKLVFANPESLLSVRGRELLKSSVYQENVVSCVKDEAHCVSMWGEDFRKLFSELSTLKALFPDAVTLALTATATPDTAEYLIKSLALITYKVIAVSPNQKNVYLNIQRRPNSNLGLKGFEVILKPLAEKLNVQREHYPMTIIYMHLRYCGYGYKLFENVIRNHYVGDNICPRARLFAQFHASCTTQMKEDILKELKKSDSRIRVVFATTALGMGVDAPNISNIIHISPPSTLESFVQEIGRGGRNGVACDSLLYFNNSDLASKYISESMKKYCVWDRCLRVFLLNYFGFKSKTQINCCKNCNVGADSTIDIKLNALDDNKKIARNIVEADMEMLKVELLKTVEDINSDENVMFPFHSKINTNIVNEILRELAFISCESDLLSMFGI